MCILCIVNIFIFLFSSPSCGKCDAFYLRPKTAPKGSVWYDSVPVGIHTLQQTVTKMCKEAGFDGYYTNHSLRATAATRLYAAGVDEQLIAEKTGHRSSAIRAYKRTSEEQQQSVSDLIQKQSTVSASKSKK